MVLSTQSGVERADLSFDVDSIVLDGGLDLLQPRPADPVTTAPPESLDRTRGHGHDLLVNLG